MADANSLITTFQDDIKCQSTSEIPINAGHQTKSTFILADCEIQDKLQRQFPIMSAYTKDNQAFVSVFIWKLTWKLWHTLLKLYGHARIKAWFLLVARHVIHKVSNRV